MDRLNNTELELLQEFTWVVKNGITCCALGDLPIVFESAKIHRLSVMISCVTLHAKYNILGVPADGVGYGYPWWVRLICGYRLRASKRCLPAGAHHCMQPGLYQPLNRKGL